MKKQLTIINFVAATFFFFEAKAQNVPNDTTPSLGDPTYMINYPASFNASPNTAPSTFNFIREYIPLVPMMFIPVFDSSKNTALIINTTYTNGWGEPLMSINRNNTEHDIITPYWNRTSDTSLDFLPYADSFHRVFRNDVFSKQFDYYKTPIGGYDNCAYTKTISTSPSSAITNKTYLPGKQMAGSDRGATTTITLNGIDEAYRLEFDSAYGGRICPTYYPEGKLRKTLTVNAHGQKDMEYTDENNRIVCKMIYAGGTAGNDGWLTTFYIYDLLGRLIFMVPPAAAANINSSLGCITNIYDYCYGYQYDDRGNCISKRIPGKASFDLFAYNRYGELVLTQSPNQNAKNEWLFNVYDKLGRVMFGGKYTGTEDFDYWRGVSMGTTTPNTHYYPNSSTVPAASTLEYWLANDFTNGASYPDSLFGCEIYVYNYYDDYADSPANLHSFATTFSSQYLSGAGIETPAFYPGFGRGKLTASKVKILDNGVSNNFSNFWIKSIYFYDVKDRLIQTQTLNPWNKWDTITNQYNFVNQPVLTLATYHFWPIATMPNSQISTRYNYGAKTGRLKGIDMRTDKDSSWMAIVSYEYDDLGRVKTKWLGGDGGGTAEVQNLTYNLRGQLMGINAFALGWNLTAFGDITYASKMAYDERPGFTENRYDGLLAGYRWESGSNVVKGYGYEYDTAGRLIHAEYEDQTGTTGWNKTTHDYTVSNLTYDNNGNILSMKQRGPDVTNNPADIDDLTYSYTGNQLTSVNDAGTSSNIHAFGYNAAPSTSYTYDSSGNLQSDVGKAIDTIVYNYLNLPIRVHKTNNDYEKSIYSADGIPLQKTISENGNTTTERYWGPFVFKDDTLQYVLHQEGRARWLPDSNFYKFDFFVEDHLGNVRTVVTEDKSEGVTIQAGFEMTYANVEESIFDCIAQVRENSPAGTPQDLMSARLNGAEEDHRVGAAVLVHAMAGDQINLRAYGYYEDTSTTNMNTYTTSESMISTLIGVLGTGTGVGGEGGNTGVGTSTISNLLTSTNYNAYDAIVNNITDTAYPRSYLNYLVFDESMNLVPDQCQAIQLTGAPSTWQLLQLNGNVTLSQNGYVLVYVSGTSNMNTWFDNVHFVTIKGRLMQEQHYYPHGLYVDGGVSTPSLRSNYLFETNKLQQEIGLEWSHFHARQYDQQLGRFNSIDALADNNQESFTPYHFCSNDPANLVDPLGLWNEKKLVIITAKRMVQAPDGADGTDASQEGDISTGSGQTSHQTGIGGSNDGTHPTYYQTEDKAGVGISMMVKEEREKRIAAENKWLKTHQRNKSVSDQFANLALTAGTVAVADGPELGPADVTAAVLLLAGTADILLTNMLTSDGTHTTQSDPNDYKPMDGEHFDGDAGFRIPSNGPNGAKYIIGGAAALDLYYSIKGQINPQPVTPVDNTRVFHVYHGPTYISPYHH